VHDGADEKPAGICQQMTLAAFDLLARVVSRGVPASVVFTDWLSITPADGLASRPSASRVSINSSWLIEAQSPHARQRKKKCCTVVKGGKSFGRSRHWQQLCAT
jgi:hypothetical protein